jgi:hypothetical protein
VRRLLNVPCGVAGCAVPCGRTGQPSILGESCTFYRRAHRTRTIHADPILRRTAAGSRQANIDAPEILVDRPERGVARVKVDREVNGATRRLANGSCLLRGADRIAISGRVSKIGRIARMPFPNRHDLQSHRRQARRLRRRQRRPARGRVAVVAGDEIDRDTPELARDIAGVGCHVDAPCAADAWRRRRQGNRWRCALASGEQQAGRQQHRQLSKFQDRAPPRFTPQGQAQTFNRYRRF